MIALSPKALLVVLFMSAYASAQSTRVVMKAKLAPAGSFNIEGNSLKGSLTKVGNTYRGKNLVLDLTGLKSGMDLRDKHIQEHFETSKFPSAELLEAEGKDGKFTGKLKIRGVTKPVTGTYEVSGKQGKARFTTKMSDFKIKKASYMGLGVKDEIEVEAEMPVPN
ncbi:MAG TPA: YceI family protein [Bdellovibrionota bacterium]|jgi:polyisoprenoid-binding protein YceI|nr:YceI family protein [Bdellovibrionota bacterium]